MKNRCRVIHAAVLGLTLAGCGESKTDHIVARRAEEALPKSDPFAEAWEDAPEHEAVLMTQNVVPPIQPRQSVQKVSVRALHDGSWLAMRLDWADPTDDHNVTTTVFSDAAAVQFPGAREGRPSDMMGHAGAPVHIVYFRAAWQTEDNVAEVYPNNPPIYHPQEAAAEGAPRQEMERAYAPAAHAGNPTVVRPDGASVIAFSAEGFGTLSPGEGGFAVDGGGRYRDGRWYVVLSREIGDPATSPIAPGQRSVAAVAIWDGSNGDVGPRKQRSIWIDLEVSGDES